MAQFHKVSKAFQATNRETGEGVVDSYGNQKWMFQVENQGPEGWMSVQRKPDAEMAAGDYVYGIVDTWPEGKAKFVRQQVPEGTSYPGPAPSKTATPKAQPEIRGNSVEEKLDYLISLVENGPNFPGGPASAQSSNGGGAPVDDDAEVDLSSLDY